MTESTERYYHRHPYNDFVKSEGIPVLEGFSVDCHTAPLEPWPRLGGLGAYVHLVGRGDCLSCYIVEIPAAGELKPERHLHDELIYVVRGRGSTAIELPDGRTHSFEWGPSSLFGIPLNAPHQHFNASGSEPARLAAVTNLQLVLNLFHNVDFVYGSTFAFKDRIGDDRYFRGEGEFRAIRSGRHQWETNFVPDVLNFTLPDWKERGAGGASVNFTLAESTMHAHTSEFPTGTYKKAHRHMAGAHIFCVTGHGYTLLWKEGENPVDSIRSDWYPGVLYAPPDDYFHQHFNTAADPSRYLALAFGGVRYPTLDETRRNHEEMDRSVKEGGRQIEYEDEDARIRDLFERELGKHGVEVRMPPRSAGASVR